MYKYFLGTVLACCSCVGLYAECPSNGLIVVVNKGNPTEGLSMAQLKRLLMGDQREWPDKKPVLLVSAQPQSPVYKCMLSVVAHMSDTEYVRYNAGAEFRGGEPVQIRVAVSGPSAAVIVSSDVGSLAIVDAAGLSSVASSVRVIKINGKLLGEPGYPL